MARLAVRIFSSYYRFAYATEPLLLDISACRTVSVQKMFHTDLVSTSVTSRNPLVPFKSWPRLKTRARRDLAPNFACHIRRQDIFGLDDQGPKVRKFSSVSGSYPVMNQKIRSLECTRLSSPGPSELPVCGGILNVSLIAVRTVNWNLGESSLIGFAAHCPTKSKGTACGMPQRLSASSLTITTPNSINIYLGYGEALV